MDTSQLLILKVSVQVMTQSHARLLSHHQGITGLILDGVNDILYRVDCCDRQRSQAGSTADSLGRW